MKLAIVVMLAALSVGAQTANVIELEPSDTARAQKAWDALQKAKNNWAVVIGEMDMRYARKNDVPSCLASQGCATTTSPKAGFESGFEFSKDFRFIVPKPATSGVIGNGVWTEPRIIPGVNMNDCIKTSGCVAW